MSCGMLLSSPYLGLHGQWERKEWMMWLDLLKIRACKGLSHVSSGGPAWKKQPKSRGRIGNLGQVPCSQGKPTLRLQVVTKRKTPLSLCKIGLCWLCLAAYFYSLRSVLTRQRQPNASCLFLNVFGTSACYCNLCSVCHPSSLLPSQS